MTRLGLYDDPGGRLEMRRQITGTRALKSFDRGADEEEGLSLTGVADSAIGSFDAGSRVQDALNSFDDLSAQLSVPEPAAPSVIPSGAPRGQSLSRPPTEPTSLLASPPDPLSPYGEAESAPPSGTVAGGTRATLSADLIPDQFNMGLSTEDAYAACGPAAAIAFARQHGRNPSAEEALALAREVGWTRQQGMAGPQSQLRLLEKMGVSARLEQGADWEKIARDVQGGNPVTISTPAHYFVAVGYDPESGRFDFGASGTALRAGKRWMTPQEVAAISPPQATLYTDAPDSARPSVATTGDADRGIGLGPPAPTPTPSGSFSPQDEVFRRHAPEDLRNDPQFISIVAGTVRAEGGFNPDPRGSPDPTPQNPGARSYGPFQMHDDGAGRGTPIADRLDWDKASAIMVPQLADAYRRYKAQGLTGPELMVMTAGATERPSGWGRPDFAESAAAANYRRAYGEVTGGQTPSGNPVGDALGATGRAIGDAVGPVLNNAAHTLFPGSFVSEEELRRQGRDAEAATRRAASDPLGTAFASAPGRILGGADPFGGSTGVDAPTEAVRAGRAGLERIPGVQNADRNLRGPGGLTPLDVGEGIASASIPILPGKAAKAGQAASELPQQIFGPRGELISTVGKAGDAILRSGDDALKLAPEITPELQRRLPNLSRLAIGEDLKATLIRTAMDQPAPEVQTHEQTLDLARRLGKTEADFLKSPIYKVWSAQEQTALRSVLIDAGRRDEDLVAQIAAKGGVDAMTPEEKVAALNSMTDLARLVNMDKAVGRNFARGLESRKIILNEATAKAITGSNTAEAAKGQLRAANRRAAMVEGGLTQRPPAQADPEAIFQRELAVLQAESGRLDRVIAGLSTPEVPRTGVDKTPDLLRALQDEIKAEEALVRRQWEERLALPDREAAQAERAASAARGQEIRAANAADQGALNEADRSAAKDWTTRLAQWEREIADLDRILKGQGKESARLDQNIARAGAERTPGQLDQAGAERFASQIADKQARDAIRDAEREFAASLRKWEKEEATAAKVQQRQTLQAIDVLGKLDPDQKVTEDMLRQWIELRQSGDALEAAKFLRGLADPGWGNRIQLLRVAGVLSSTTTHLLQAVSNVASVASSPVLKGAAVGVDVAQAALTGGPRTRFAAEIPAEAGAWLGGVAEGARSAKVALTTGISPRLAARLDQPTSGFGAEHIPGLSGRSAEAVNTIAEGPLRLFLAGDELLRGPAKGGQVAAHAVREAAQEGWTGEKLGTRVQEILENLEDFPELMKRADADSARLIFQEKRPETDRIVGAKSAIPFGIGQVLLPLFIRTPYNIAAQGLGMTPAGLLNVLKLAKEADRAPVVAEQLAKRGEAVDAAARVLVGGGIMAGGAALYQAGLFTGPFPATDAERKALPTGWQPWALHVGDKYVSLEQLGPLAHPLALGAVGAYAAQQGKLAALAKYPEFVLDQASVMDFSKMIEAVKDSSESGARWENWTENLATQFVPYSALQRQITQAMGIAQRDPHGAIEALAAINPLTAEDVPPKRDKETGETQPPGVTGPARFITPLRVTQEGSTPPQAPPKYLGVMDQSREDEIDEARAVVNAYERDPRSLRPTPEQRRLAGLYEHRVSPSFKAFEKSEGVRRREIRQDIEARR